MTMTDLMEILKTMAIDIMEILKIFTATLIVQIILFLFAICGLLLTTAWAIIDIINLLRKV